MSVTQPPWEAEAPAGVVNIRSGEPYDVFIGRPSKWGNPFKIGRDGNREAVIAKYKQWLTELYDGRYRPLFYEATTELSGKVLGCFCAPLRCHGDVIREVCNAYWKGLWSS